ncbi:hypothetical protein BSLG_010404 [Batrachochytrium salamandrivorans]|nr:hypothetical protein BSLG_010404 [Batrachochytrium salamandrivorans]
MDPPSLQTLPVSLYPRDTIASEAASLGGSTVPSDRVSVSASAKSVLPIPETANASDIHTEASLRPDSLHTQQRTPVTTTTLGRRDKIRKNRQSQLLLVSLLENFCMMYDESGDRNRKLFYVLCRQLSNMGSALDGTRLFAYRLVTTNFSEYFNLKTSRYLDDFEELDCLEEDTSSVESPSLNPSSNDSEILFHADDSQRTDSSIVPRKMVSSAADYRRKQKLPVLQTNDPSMVAVRNARDSLDVKPRNIYWKACSDNTGGGDWKLGDFGLATVFDLRAETTSNDGSIVSQASDKRDRRDKHAKHMDRTIGVGTITYASPEQLDPQRYDTVYSPLSDIFSLGIILFELMRVSNGNGKGNLIGNLRNGILPKTFVKRYPKEATLILCMTAEDPRKRPLAQFLLEDLELFNVQDTASEVNPHKVTPAIMQPGIVNAREHSSHQHESTDPDRQLFRVRDCAIQTMYQHGCQRCEEMSVEMDRLKCRIVELEKRLGSCASSM